MIPYGLRKTAGPRYCTSICECNGLDKKDGRSKARANERYLLHKLLLLGIDK